MSLSSTILHVYNFSCFPFTRQNNSSKMLVSSRKSLSMFLTLLALLFLFLARRHATSNSIEQTEIGYAYETTDQTILSSGTTSLQQTTVHDKLPSNTSNDIEANWSATIAARTLLQKVREFRISTQANYNDKSKRSVRKRLEGTELELVKLGKESFDTKKILRGVQELKAALKAAEDAIARGPEFKTMSSKFGNRGEVSA